jgi:DNA-directed RNA polymerase sigma subunit (sigma70/sigma32)
MEGKIYTFKEIGEMYGKSHERIRQYKNQAIRRLAAAAKKSPIYREIAGLPKSNLAEPVAAGAESENT